MGRRTYRSGLAATLHPIANYAGVSAMIMAFHLTGRYVEEMARMVRDGLEMEVPILRRSGWATSRSCAPVNQEGLLKVRATRVGKDTFLAQVIRLVEA